MKAAGADIEVGSGSLLIGRINECLGADKITIASEDEFVFRRYGVYTQRPAEAGYFMVRIRIPGGELDSYQLTSIAALANDYARGLADITVRQSIQLHWVRLRSLPAILARLSDAGLSTVETCGDSVRNIVNCPVSGVDEDELFDTSPLVRKVNDFFANSRDFADLPRKFKIAITGCARRCVYPEINDIGIFAVPDHERGGVAFRARVGGGLSISPRFGQDLGVLVQPEEVPELCGAIAFVLQEVDYEDHARSGGVHYLVDEARVGEFLERIERKIGRRLRRTGDAAASPVLERDRSHIGIHGERTNGLYYIGISTLAGRTSGPQLNRLAGIASEYGSGRVRTANTQDLVLLDIPEWNLEAACSEMDLAGLNYDPSWTQRSVIACSGIEFCKQAVAETKSRAARLCRELADELDLEEPVRISVTGCPNSCGQHHISDIGLEGSTITIDGMKTESFQVILGGGVGRIESVGRRIGVRIPAEELAESVARLLFSFRNQRFDGESFQEFCLRHTDEELAVLLKLEFWEAKTVSGVAVGRTANDGLASTSGQRASVQAD